MDDFLPKLRTTDSIERTAGSDRLFTCAVFRNSVRLSVRLSYACFVTKLKNVLPMS